MLRPSPPIDSVWAVQKFENRLRFDKVRDSLKVGRFFETQCRTDSERSRIVPDPAGCGWAITLGGHIHGSTHWWVYFFGACVLRTFAILSLFFAPARNCIFFSSAYRAPRFFKNDAPTLLMSLALVVVWTFQRCMPFAPDTDVVTLSIMQSPRSTCSSSVVTLARPPTSSLLKITDRSFCCASPCL